MPAANKALPWVWEDEQTSALIFASQRPSGRSFSNSH